MRAVIDRVLGTPPTAASVLILGPIQPALINIVVEEPSCPKNIFWDYEGVGVWLWWMPGFAAQASHAGGV